VAALVIAEHDNASIRPATLNTVTAAAQCGGDVHVLVAGANAGEAAKAAAQIAGVAKVIHAEGAQFEHGLAENIAAQVLAIASNYSHILFPGHGQRQEHRPARRGQAGRRRRSPTSSRSTARYFRAPDLCRQRHRHRAER
jgi:electron transfer flavoprotein alpha subunit